MINVITICQDGHLIPESASLGRTGEHNATLLRFGFFEKLNGELVSAFQKYLVAILPEGTLRYRIAGDFSVPAELTSTPELAFQKMGTTISSKVTFLIAEAAELDIPGPEKMQTVVNELYKYVPDFFKSFMTKQKLEGIAQKIYNNMKLFAENDAKESV